MAGREHGQGLAETYDCHIDDGRLVVSSSLAGVSRRPYLRFTQTVTADADGHMTMTLDAVRPDNSFWLPRFGPYESYCDSYHHTRQTWHESSAEVEYVPYIRPQEHGNHFGVKALEIGRLKFEDNFECNVSHYSIAQLQKAAHTNEPERDGNIYLRVDYKVSGIGSAACGPALLEP